MAISNWDRFHANMGELKQGGNVSENAGRGDEKLTRAEKRERRMKNHMARQGWRNYNDGRVTYFSVIFTETLVTVFAVLFYFLFIIAFVLGFVGLASMSNVMSVLMFGGLLAVLMTPHLRRLLKRKRFIKKLNKACNKNGYRLYRYRNALASLYRPDGESDFAVETRDTVYECMFYPAPRRLSVLRFDTPGEVKIVTGIVRNRFKEALGMNEPRVRVKPFGFEPNTKSTTKKVVKVALLNPVPYELYYFDKKDGKTVQGGSGTEFYGYTAYSGNGFINTLDRQATRE